MNGTTRSKLARIISDRRPATLYTIVAAGLILILLVSISTGLPDNEIRVSLFEPTGHVGLRTNFSVKFSKPMVHSDSLDKPVLDPPIIFTPPIRGLARWIEKDLLRFFPETDLLPATEYKARVASDKTWLSGFKIVSKDEYSFRTPALDVSIQSSTAPDDERPGHVRIYANLRFRYPVDVNELRRRITIKGKAGALLPRPSFVLAASRESMPAEGSEGGTYDIDFTLTTEPIQQSEVQQEYALTISSGLECLNCGIPLAEAFTSQLFVGSRPELVVHSLRPQTFADGGVIYIYFYAPVSPDEAAPYISVEPKTDFTLEGDYSQLSLRGDFKPGASITVNIANGLRSQHGAVLERDFSSKVVFPDLEPSVGFSARAVFLPRAGNGLMEFKTVNIGDVAVEVEQVFENNLVHFLTSGYGDRGYYYGSQFNLGRSLLVKDLATQGTRNEPMLSTVDLVGMVGDTSKGIFKVSVRDKHQRWIGDSRYAMITDIGIVARFSDDYLMVWANSLEKAEPIGKATVVLLSKNNQALAEGRTDSRGIAVFKNIKERLAGYEPFVITVSREGDLAYLRLDETLLPISDFDVAGRPYLSSGYEAFLYADRGIYRPGDTAHFVSIVRGVAATVPPEFPYFLTIYDNRGRKYTSARMSTAGSAIATYDFEVPTYAATGKYSIAAEIGDDIQIGRAEFLVEEFMPDRIKVTLSTPSGEYFAGDTIVMSASGKYLFGPPAASHKVSGHVTIESQDFSPSGWSEYTFTDGNRAFKKMEIDLPSALLDDTGGHTQPYVIPQALVAPSALKGLLSATVSEEGGRGVSAYAEVRIHPYRRYVGLRLNTEGYAKIDEPLVARIIGVGADGRATAIPKCDVRFYRVTYNTVLKKDKTGVYRYMSERKPYVQDSTTVAIGPEGADVSFVPHDYGSYEIIATDHESGHSSAVTCYASGWGYAPWAMTNPDKIELKLDKESYSVGDNAILQVRAPFGGKLLVTVEKGEVLETISRDMPDNTAEIKLPVRKEHFPNVYVTASVIRPAAALEANMPARAFGLAPLKLTTDSKRLGISMAAPDVVTPKSDITVSLKVDRPRETHLTLAAVDAGILQLTDFATPDPLEFFHGKKQPRLKPYDLYSFIYPHAVQSKSHLGAGDKMFAASRLRHLNPITSKRVRPVALWSGLVKTDANGNVSVSFTLPEFNGKLVLMAVGSQGDMFGSATDEIIVKDKIVLQESFPRFVSPNDVFDGLVTVFNNTGAKADISVTARAEGPAEFVSPTTVTVSLDNNRQGNAVFKVRAKLAPGKISFGINASAGEDKSQLTLELANRPAVPLVTLHGSGVAVKGSPAEFVFPGGWLQGTDQYAFKTSGMPAVSFARNVQYLLSYPYGCVEQVTSRLFPLLYFDDLVRVAEPGLIGGKGHEYFIQEGILRLNSMHLPDGSFSYWPGSDRSNNWATVYASHFLSEAARAGYFVDRRYLDQLYAHLEGILRGRGVSGQTDVHRIYAAYVLGLAGRLEQRDITYLKNVTPDKLPVFTRYHLAGALALSGNLAEAGRLVPLDVQPNVFEPETGGDFNSPVRTDAILLETMLIVDPASPSVDVLAKSLMERAGVNQWYTTQDNAFALMALGKYFKKRTQFGYTGSIAIEGLDAKRMDSTGSSLTRKDLGGRRATIEVDSGEGACFYYWQASGVPETNAAPEFDHGMTVRREYLTEKGTPIDPAHVALGDRVVCVIKAETISKPLQNVVINDLLPAGFEIENPRLKTSPRLSWIPDMSASIDYQDIRDDRLLLFTNLNPGLEMKFHYSLRAISSGEFKVPPIAAECMYNPLIASSASSGAVTIVR